MAVSRSTATTLILCLMFIALGVFGWGVYRKIQLDNGSGDLAIAIVQSAVETRTAQTLIENAHPSLLTESPANMLEDYVAVSMRYLGSLQSMVSITGESESPILSLPGSTVDAQYIIDLEMETARAQAIVDLRYESSRWLVTAFDFESEPLMQ